MWHNMRGRGHGLVEGSVSEGRKSCIGGFDLQTSRIQSMGANQFHLQLFRLTAL
jgi:hypothetical protein